MTDDRFENREGAYAERIKNYNKRIHEQERAQVFRDCEAFRKIPTTPGGQEAYIGEADSDFERLARYWECDTKTSKRDPAGDTPLEIGKERFRQFWKLWGKRDG